MNTHNETTEGIHPLRTSAYKKGTVKEKLLGIKNIQENNNSTQELNDKVEKIRQYNKRK